jgi:hypothetical protein
MALIGSLAINMSVRTQALVQGLKKGGDAINKFAATASSRLGAAMAPLTGAGRATAGVVNDFYVKPFMKVARIIAGPVVSAFKGLRAGEQVGYMASGFKSVATWAASAAMSVGRIAARGAMGGIKLVASGIGMVATAATSAFHAFESMLVPMLAIGGVGVAAIIKCVKAASDLQEQGDRAVALFGEANAEKIRKQAAIMGEAFGVSRAGFTESASALGGQFAGMGYAADDATKLGIAMTKLALDVSSATQMTHEEAFTRMASGIAGEAEAVRRWGVDLTEVNLKLKGVAMGMKLFEGELTQGQKSQVRVALLTEKLAYAQNNLAKTADSAENATKGLWGRIENLAAEIGAALMPYVAAFLTDMNVGIQAVTMAWKGSTLAVSDAGKGVLSSSKNQVESVGWIQKSVMWAADTWQSFKMKAIDAILSVNKVIINLMSSMRVAAATFDLLRGAKEGEGAAAGLETGIQSMQDMRRSLIKYQEAEAAKPPPSVGIAESFQEAKRRIQEMRDKATSAGSDTAGMKPTNILEATKKEGKAHFAKAAVVGTQEAANAFLRSRYGGGAGKKPEEETAANTRELVGLFRRVANTIAGSGAADVMEAPGSIIGTVLGGLF